MIKLKDYLQIPPKNTLLVESNLSRLDLNWLYDILDHPKNDSHILQSHDIVNVFRNNNKLIFSYNRELYNFTNTFVDVLDTLKLQFESDEGKDGSTINITVYL